MDARREGAVARLKMISGTDAMPAGQGRCTVTNLSVFKGLLQGKGLATRLDFLGHRHDCRNGGFHGWTDRVHPLRALLTGKGRGPLRRLALLLQLGDVRGPVLKGRRKKEGDTVRSRE